MPFTPLVAALLFALTGFVALAAHAQTAPTGAHACTTALDSARNTGFAAAAMQRTPASPVAASG